MRQFTTATLSCCFRPLQVVEMMQVTSRRIDPDALREQLMNNAAGAYVGFEGWIRNENEGQDVLRLEYESYDLLAVSEGQKVIAEANAKYPLLQAMCVHRTGMLELGECAVWVGVSSAHRDEAFVACRFIIDQVKIRLPIWKKEYYVNGNSGWVNCERCASAHQ
jgi:molybdopterin synthase catalytic subunit